jgi:hypothetical protein
MCVFVCVSNTVYTHTQTQATNVTNLWLVFHNEGLSLRSLLYQVSKNTFFEKNTFLKIFT